MSLSGFAAKPDAPLTAGGRRITLPTLNGYAHLLLCCLYEAAATQDARRGRGCEPDDRWMASRPAERASRSASKMCPYTSNVTAMVE
jgi:hypothetical protein